jgi:hypothetical protein
MRAALGREAEAQRLVLAGEQERARVAFREAAEHYRDSWELAPPGSYGRLVGMLKAAILAGGGAPEADYARTQLHPVPAGSPTVAYVRALCALVQEDDRQARGFAAAMRGGSEAFDRAAQAIDALARRDRVAYAEALASMVSDFEQRSAHLTGVAIADTALMLQRLADRRGIAAELSSPLLPAL